MSTIITYVGAVTPIAPIVVDGYESQRTSGNVVHNIVGRSSPDVTLGPASLRTGTLELVFPDELDAKAAEDAHALPVAFTLSSDDRSTIEMYYVVNNNDRVRRALDDETREVWIVSVPFQEVAP